MINFKDFRELLLEGEGILGKDRNFEKRTYVFNLNSGSVLKYKNMGWGYPDSSDNVIIINDDGVKYLHLKQIEDYDPRYPENLYFKIREGAKIGAEGDGTKETHLLYYLNKSFHFSQTNMGSLIKNISSSKPRPIPEGALKPSSLNIDSPVDPQFPYWTNAESYINQIETSIRESGVFSANGQEALMEMINRVAIRPRNVNFDLEDYLTYDEEGKAIGKQMKYFGEILGPLYLMSSGNTPWKQGSNIAGWTIPDSDTFALIDFVMYTSSPEGELYPWKISSKMITGGNTVKNSDLENAYNNPGELWTLIEDHANKPTIQQRLAEIGRSDRQLMKGIITLRSLFNIIYNTTNGGVWWGSTLAGAWLGSESTWSQNRSLVEGVMARPLLSGVSSHNAIGKLIEHNPTLELVISRLRSPSIQEMREIPVEIPSGDRISILQELSQISTHSGSSFNVLARDAGGWENIQELNLDVLVKSSGKLLENYSKNPNYHFSRAVRKWFELIVTDQVFYLYTTYKTGQFSFELKGLQTGESNIPQFKNIFLRYKDQANAIGFDIKA